MPAGNSGQDSSAARSIVLWVSSAVPLSVRLEFLGLSFFRSRFCHWPGRYHQLIEILSFGSVLLLSCLWIFGRSTVDDSLAAFEVVCGGVSWFFWHLFNPSGYDEHFVRLPIFVT